MGKFYIECPRCGGMNQASTSLFSKKVVKCTCGNEIDVKAARAITKVCSGCGTAVVCDQAKLKGKKCPVCGTEITTAEATAEYKLVPISCPQCSCCIEADKTKPMAICPICDHQFDIQKEIAKENMAKSGAISVIKYEGDNSTFIWKHPIEDFNVGSQLIVHENQLAVFFLNGEALDTFGPGRHTLSTENIPLLGKVVTIQTNNVNPFHAEVYFINCSEQMDLKWGTPSRINMRDPESEMYVSIGASGSFSISVDREKARLLLTKLVGTTKGISWSGEGAGFTKSIKNAFRGPLVRDINSTLASVITEKKFSLFEIDMKLGELSEALSEKVAPVFAEYGLIVSNFCVEVISLPEDDPEFVKWRKDFNIRQARIREENARADIAAAEQRRRLIEKETEKLERISEAEGEAAATRLQGFADADVMRAKGYTEKDLIDAEVQKAYAAGMGQFGANAGSGGGGGVASDMMNMMMGMKMFDAMSGKMEGAFNGNQASPAQPAAQSAGWACECGMKNIQTNFCPQCGKPKPAPAETWNCTCGQSGITTKFCPQCGKPKPAPAEAWTCECGKSGITTKFCPECGKPKPVADTWDCECGAKGIKTKFCPECGKPKPVADTWDCECGAKGIKTKFCPECGKPKA